MRQRQPRQAVRSGNDSTLRTSAPSGAFGCAVPAVLEGVHDLRHIRFHDLRHTCATSLAQQAAESDPDIQAYMGAFQSDHHLAPTYIRGVSENARNLQRLETSTCVCQLIGSGCAHRPGESRQADCIYHCSKVMVSDCRNSGTATASQPNYMVIAAARSSTASYRTMTASAPSCANQKLMTLSAFSVAGLLSRHSTSPIMAEIVTAFRSDTPNCRRILHMILRPEFQMNRFCVICLLHQLFI